MDGYILVLAMLLLGGVIATVGDRLGSKVGKARLSLFKLRPRTTATVVNILTGSVISAVTLGILFAVSGQLRESLFRWQTIRLELRQAEQDLVQAQTQIKDFETDKRQLREEKSSIEVKLNQTRQRLDEVSQHVEALETERQNLVAQRDRVLAEIVGRDEEITALDRQIAAQEKRIASQEAQQEALAARKSELEEEIALLVENNEELRRAFLEGDLVILRNQVLASAQVRVLDPKVAQQAVNALLAAANRKARELILPVSDDPEPQLIRITEVEVEQLAQRLRDGQNYVIRIQAARNSLIGESPIRVYAYAVPNRVIFEVGTVITTYPLNLGDPADNAIMAAEKIADGIEHLISAAKFRARSAGFLGNTLQVSGLDYFQKTLLEYQKPVEIQLITTEATFVTGPFVAELIAFQEGEVLFRSNPKTLTKT